MWRASWLCLVAACFRPSPFEPCELTCEANGPACPDDLICLQGRCTTTTLACGNLGPDATVPVADGPPATTCPDHPPKFAGMTAPLHDGASYTVSSVEHIAVYEETAGELVETVLDSTGAPQGDPIPKSSTHTAQGFGRLAPTGMEAFLSGRNNTSARFELLKTTRIAAGSWTVPTVAPLSDNVLNLLVPGTPTVTTPRHMVATIAGSPQELIEQGDGTWNVQGLETPPGTVAMSDPNLTPDGLHVVFVGQGPASANAFAIFIADRDGLDNQFGPSRLLLDVQQDVTATPVLSSDCAVLYFSLGGKIHRIPPP